MEALPLHHHQEYMDGAVGVLNEEWPRSEAARRHALEKSSDDLPYSLVFVKTEDGKSEVIGFSRICSVIGDSEACFMESVVIRKCDRGKGYGRTIMELTEKQAKKFEFNKAYLTTHDKQDFYLHLNYEYCQPVVSLGNNSSLIKDGNFLKMLQKLSVSQSEDKSPEPSLLQPSPVTINGDQNVNGTPPPPPPPPPPSPAVKSSPTKSLFSSADVKYDPSRLSWMKKDLSA